jgi:DNA-binding NtrC family response regulator
MNAGCLVVAANPDEQASYVGWLRDAGHDVVAVATIREALAAQRARRFGFTLADLASTSDEAVEFVRLARALNGQGAVVVVSPRDAAESVLAMVKAGADDVLFRPVDPAALRARIESCQDVAAPRRREPLTPAFGDIVARSQRMLRLLTLAARVSSTDATVLIEGETGTGKEILARAIHAASTRAHVPLLTINCAAIPETLLESELFGYRRGAFTGAYADKPGLLATADGGTLFLDEVAELPMSLQAKLLRFLQHGTYLPLGARTAESADVCVLAATNVSLADRVAASRFRQDLFYRLAVFPLQIPPLRERQNDILPLALHVLARLRDRAGREVPGLSRDAATFLMAQPWHGNVRELENVLARAVIVSTGRLLTSHDLRHPAGAGHTRTNDPTHEWPLPDGGVDLPALTRGLVAAAVARSGHNVSAAARLLGLSRPALRYRLRKYGIAR